MADARSLLRAGRPVDGRGFLDWTDADLVAHARRAGDDVTAGLRLADRLGPVAADLGRSTWTYLRTLASLGAGDLTAARVVEPHLDALAILEQAGALEHPPAPPPPGSTWGVYAAHAPGQHLAATEHDGGWLLDGTKPWCSLAGDLSHAVITAHVDETHRRAFAVDLAHPGVEQVEQPWVARGLRAVRSTTVRFTSVPALPVGPNGWYLSRPGFAWGGIGVAAVWVGGAAALAQTVLDSSRDREPDQVALLHLGRLDEALWTAQLALRAAADDIDVGRATGEAGGLLAARVRNVASTAAETALAEVSRALGPGPLTGDEEHARRVADLGVYVRQHHGERDLARTGALLHGLDR